MTATEYQIYEMTVCDFFSTQATAESTTFELQWGPSKDASVNNSNANSEFDTLICRINKLQTQHRTQPDVLFNVFFVGVFINMALCVRKG